ncbi:unnamed protein product [Adineta steineri]|uniref:Uncharacterized protein n=2 Tax=Adineta steineri TaxID=433720 RepID=A0A815L1B8_9BILA|nr:unnamed protein product [Adineta steineri]
MPAKKVTSTTQSSSSANKSNSKPVTSSSKVIATKTTDVASAPATDKPEKKIIKYAQMKEVIPSEMAKLRDLTKWPIIVDEIGNLKTFYRMNELVLEFNPPLTVQRVKNALQRIFFGFSFDTDGSIDDHRKYTIPTNVNRLLAINMEDKDIGQCVEELRAVCDQIHPDLFDTVFRKADVNESGRDNLDRLFKLTQTPDELRQCDYYQFGANARSEVPFICVWITRLTEIPSSYDDFFGPRFQKDEH